MCAFLPCPTRLKSWGRVKKYFHYTCHSSHHHFLKHYSSLPKTRAFASFRAISAAHYAAEQGNTQAFSVAVVASACVGFHVAVVGVLVLVSVAACCVQHPASSRVCVPAAASLAVLV